MADTFSERLKDVMESRGVRSCQLSKLTGIRTSSITDWIKRRYVPKFDKVKKLAQALNVDPLWLAGEPNTDKAYTVDVIDYLLINAIKENKTLNGLFDTLVTLSPDDLALVADIVAQFKKHRE